MAWLSFAASLAVLAIVTAWMGLMISEIRSIQDDIKRTKLRLRELDAMLNKLEAHAHAALATLRAKEQGDDGSRLWRPPSRDGDADYD